MTTAAAKGTGTASDAMIGHQQAVLQQIMNDADGTINAAFSDAIASVMPSAAAFRSAYTKEQNRLQDAQDDQETDSSTPAVSLAWLQRSGFLQRFLDDLQQNMEKAQKESAAAASTAAATAYQASRATSVAMVAQASGAPVSQVQMAPPGTNGNQQLTAGQSVAALLQASGDASASANQTAQQVKTVLVAGAAAGLTGFVLMTGVQTVLQGALGAALGFGHNAVTDAAQQAMSITISNNGTLVNGWIWGCHFDDSCLACIMADGSIHDAMDTMDTHNNCQCDMIPYSGPPMAGTGTGYQWFTSQDDAVQESILGPAKYEAYKAGDVSLLDLVTNEGGYLHERSLKSLGLDFRDYLALRPTAAERAAGAIQIIGPHDFTAALTAEEEDLLAEAAQLAYAPELPEVPGIVEETAAPPESPELQQMRADRAALQTQRDAVQAKQDVLSAKWAKIVTETDFEEEDEAAEAEAQLAKIEKQQAANIKKMDALDAQMARLDTKINLLANAPKNLAELQATVQDLQAERLAAIEERKVVEDATWDLKGEQYRIQQDELIPAQRQADYDLSRAQSQAKRDLAMAQLEEQAKTDPAVKQFLKDQAKYQEKDAAHREAYDELRAAEAHAKDVGAKVVWEQGPAPSYKSIRPWGPKTIPADATDEQIQAWKDYETAFKAERRTADAAQTAYLKIAGRSYGDIRTFTFAPEDIASHPAVIAAKEKAAETLAPIEAKIADLQTHIDAADTYLAALDQRIQDTSSNIRDIWASARGNISLYGPEDARVPFSDTLGIPEDQGKGLWYATKEEQFTEATPIQKILDQSNSLETAPQSKARIADDLAARLENNDAFVAMAKANKIDLSEQTSDLVMEWGSKFKPGAPMPWAMQMAARDEFGLEVTIRGTAAQLKAAETLYAKDGEALRAFMRAQYDATQEFFASNGISEVELYRGFEWPLDTPMDQLPKGVNWGRPGNYDPAAALKGQDEESYLGKVGEVGTIAPEPGQGEFEFAANALSSYSADANISWAFTRDVWGDSQDQSYRLIIGAKVPVTRIIGTAQTGFGAKAEAEIVVLGANDDTVRYTAMIVNTDLAEVVSEEQVSDALYVYKLSDGTEVSVLTKPNGSFKITHPSLGASGSKTVKTEAGVNKVLAKIGIVNTYTAPATTATGEIVTDLGAMGALVAPAEPEVAEAAAFEGAAAGGGATRYTLPEIDQQAESAIIQQAQDALAGDGVASHTDAIDLGGAIHDYLDQRIGPLADYANEAFDMQKIGKTSLFTPDQLAWYRGDNSLHGGISFLDAQAQYQQALQDETARLLDAVRGTGGASLDLADGADETIAGAISTVEDGLPTDWIAASNDQGALSIAEDTSHNRGYYRANRDGTGTIALRYGEDTPTGNIETAAVHELGHRMEDAVDGVWLREKEFYNARTAGEDFVELDKAIGVPGKTKLDQWAYEYLGKEPILVQRPSYLTDAAGNKLRTVYNYELLSTGLEWIYGNDSRYAYFLSRDEEYHKFILGLLFGAKDHVA